MACTEGLHAEGKPQDSIHALHDAAGQLQTETVDKLKAMQAHYKAIATPSQAGAHVDPAVAAHHAKIEQEYQALVADAPDTPSEWHNGAITRKR
jgi:hypothetical protein